MFGFENLCYYRHNQAKCFAIIGLLVLSAYGVDAATTNVSFGAFFFNPKTVVINAGDTIVWSLASGTANHTVTGTGADPMCGAGNIGSGCQHVFPTAGTFPYDCATPGHAGAGMTGLVMVVAALPPKVPAY